MPLPLPLKLAPQPVQRSCDVILRGRLDYSTVSASAAHASRGDLGCSCPRVNASPASSAHSGRAHCPACGLWTFRLPAGCKTLRSPTFPTLSTESFAPRMYASSLPRSVTHERVHGQRLQWYVNNERPPVQDICFFVSSVCLGLPILFPFPSARFIVQGDSTLVYTDVWAFRTVSGVSAWYTGALIDLSSQLAETPPEPVLPVAEPRPKSRHVRVADVDCLIAQIKALEERYEERARRIETIEYALNSSRAALLDTAPCGMFYDGARSVKCCV